jgi:hypothetical protein
VFLVSGTVFCVAALVMVLFMGPLPPGQRGLFALGIAGFLALWVTVGMFMVRTGLRAVRAAGRRGGEPAPQAAQSCAFEFLLPDGQAVQAKAPGRLGEPSGPDPPQLALYDPRRPGHALLLSGLWPAVWVGPSGGWEATAGVGAACRLLVALLLLAGPLLVWAFLR